MEVMQVENKQVPQCDVTVIHQDVVDRVKEKLLPDELMAQIAEFFKVFGDQIGRASCRERV